MSDLRWSGPPNSTSIEEAVSMLEIRAVLDSGGDANESDGLWRNALSKAAHSGFLEATRFLLAHGAAPTAIFEAVYNGHTNVVGELLKAGADVNRKVFRIGSPLHIGALSGNPEMTAFLIHKGAKLDAKDEFGYTPLHKAAVLGRLRAADELLKAKADAKARNKFGETPLHLLAKFAPASTNANRQEQSDDRLHFAELLLSAGADVNASDASGNTPLCFAAGLGDEGLVRLLLRHNANRNASGPNGLRAIDHARRNGHRDLENLLQTME